MSVSTNQTINTQDFAAKTPVRWCPGCGDFAILKAFCKALSATNKPVHDVVCVSGIGCAARMPYYINSYGFHTIHGRAASIATGVKLANPELDVWGIGGDGDFLSIGTNHLLHAFRRNIDINFLLINNAVYGLTKGQYSPTSIKGTRTPSSPLGSTENDFNAMQLALAAGIGFAARSIDIAQEHLGKILLCSQKHKGASLVEIYQNCVIFNDKVWQDITDKKKAADNVIILEHGEPMIFGEAKDKALQFDTEKGKFCIVTADTLDIDKIATCHDKNDWQKAMFLSMMHKQGFPVAIGVLYEKEDMEDYNEVIGKEIPYTNLSMDEFEGILSKDIQWSVP